MRLGFVGFGHLAKVLFGAMDRAKFLPRGDVLFTRRNQDRAREDEMKFGITAAAMGTVISKSDVLLLNVKPQQAHETMLQMGNLKGKKLISVLAGTKIEELKKSGAEVIRAMPNICSAVSEGMTILVHEKGCDRDFVHFTRNLFGAMGEIVTLDESVMDVATAMSGSGPGFVFRLIDAMARVSDELPYDEALKMAAQTFIGAGKMILKGAKPEDLLVQIATPQGMTQVGLDDMTKSGIDALFQRAILAAAARAKVLSNNPKK
jgi:pyrroline-5-carboxylate reductase